MLELALGARCEIEHDRTVQDARDLDGIRDARAAPARSFLDGYGLDHPVTLGQRASRRRREVGHVSTHVRPDCTRYISVLGPGTGEQQRTQHLLDLCAEDCEPTREVLLERVRRDE